MSSQINLMQMILNSSRTVFTIQSLMMMSGLSDSQKITKSIKRRENQILFGFS